MQEVYDEGGRGRGLKKGLERRGMDRMGCRGQIEGGR
jgi:hypothetical protein